MSEVLILDSADAAAHESGEHGAEHGAERRTGGTTLRSLSGDELAELVERAVAADRKFFAQNPHRQYRVRRASRAEVEELSRVKRVGIARGEGARRAGAGAKCAMSDTARTKGEFSTQRTAALRSALEEELAEFLEAGHLDEVITALGYLLGRAIAGLPNEAAQAIARGAVHQMICERDRARKEEEK